MCDVMAAPVRVMMTDSLGSGAGSIRSSYARLVVEAQVVGSGTEMLV